LLYLGEPTIGLDVVAKARIREFLLAINAEQGVTVLLITHDMDDVETLCPRMLTMDHGASCTMVLLLLSLEVPLRPIPSYL